MALILKGSPDYTLVPYNLICIGRPPTIHNGLDRDEFTSVPKGSVVTRGGLGVSSPPFAGPTYAKRWPEWYQRTIWGSN